ncbi:hypothetical protein B9Z55_012916 [Caenorhabditis nigoni]|uniref:F-box domain-containing protein n=1 Tax=Caenorhabditis nigoni TaxID=1611254 RepID=A0A2G5TZE3_9PELO|nr:hypothetical protein B9Z55_012916 [Caenorhabditis nigoni]
MASDLENLIGTIEKLSIKPVYDTNWCDMPAEIKLECIGKMDLNERLSLRCTAQAEKSLVDSQKIEFNYGRFCGHDEGFFGFVLYSDNKCNLWKHLYNKSETIGLMKYIKNVGVFENLYISFGNLFADNEQFATDDGLFTAKNIEFRKCDINNIISVLNKLKEGVESIKMNGKMSDDLSQILAISHIQNVPYWHIEYYNKTDSLRMVAQMWIETNSKIGSIFQVSVKRNGSFEEFLEHFDDRIVYFQVDKSKDERRVRIRTENADIHILLERGLDDSVAIDFADEYFRLMVIPAEMKECEYEDDCQEWICKIDTEIYEYDSDNSVDDYDYEDYDNYERDWYDSDNDGWNPDNY